MKTQSARKARELFRFNELQGCGIHAVAKPGRFGTVVEHVAEMRVASLAQHFVSIHAEAVVAFGSDVLFRDRSGKAGPTGSRFELGVGTEQIIAATDAFIDSFFVVVPILAGEGAFGSLLPRNFVLFASQLFLPLGVSFDDLIAHDESFLRDGIKFYFCTGGIRRLRPHDR